MIQNMTPSAEDACFEHSRDRLGLIIDEVRSNHDLNEKDLPGLVDLLLDIVDPDFVVEPEDSIRRLLKVFFDSTDDTYSHVLAQYQESEADLVRRFVESGESTVELGRDFEMGVSLGAREELPLVRQENGESISHRLHAFDAPVVKFDSRIASLKKTAPHVELYNDEQRKEKITLLLDERWQNWGRTVESCPSLTFVPRTSYGIQQIVKYAKEHNMNVRASGYRHSWARIFGKTGHIIISTLGLTQSTMLPNIESLPGSQYFVKGTELNSIAFLRIPEKGKKRLVRVGTAVTNQMFRRWCNDRKLDEASSLPLNVIMVEITMGGSNAPICHGAGRAHPTLSDLVYAIEYVDANGNMQIISKDKDPELMASASGCFGLLGIVTHLTMELDPMVYAIMTPRKIPIMKAIPPPPGLEDKDIPDPLRIHMTSEERAKAQAEFEKHARSDFYCEWFWFPYTSMIWVNCWNTTSDSTNAQDYPKKTGVFNQFLQTVLIQVIQQSEAVLKLEDKFPWVQTTLISKMGLYVMPDISNPKDAIKTQLPNALHFRRAIQNVRVRDMEIEIPLQPKTGSLADSKFDDEIDFSLVQKAWWDAILVAYKHTDTCPQRMPLEMRITGPSNVTLSPYRGHNLGTCSIEVLTLEVMKDIWPAHAQEILDKWMDLKDRNGNYLTTRPHWAKEWYHFTVRGRPMMEYLKETYGGAIPEFREHLKQISDKQDWNLEDARTRFSNDVFDDLFFTI